jgi:hypothetical protein
MRMASVNSVAQGPMTSRGVNGYVSWWYMNVDRNPLAWGRWNMVLTNGPCTLGTPDIVGDGDDVGSVVGRGRGGDEEEGGWSHCHGCSGGGPPPQLIQHRRWVRWSTLSVLLTVTGSVE